MRFRTILSLVFVFVLCFAATNRAAPTHTQQPAFRFLSAMDNPTVQGKILSVEDASFTLEIKKNQDAQPEQFLIDENTKVEGGKKIATHVIVHAPADK